MTGYIILLLLRLLQVWARDAEARESRFSR